MLLGRERSIRVDDLSASILTRDPGSLAFRGDVMPLREVQRRYAAWAYEQLGGKKVLKDEFSQLESEDAVAQELRELKSKRAGQKRGGESA